MTKPPALSALALSCGLLCAAAASAQSPPPAAVEASIDKLALTGLPAKGWAKLTVTSPAFREMGDIPLENTQYRADRFPGLSWSKWPGATKSYAVIMQHTDVKHPDGNPLVHWTMYNIPASVTSLPAGMTNAFAGSYGPNMRAASSPYVGPKPPAGPKHRYHIQVFALDTTLAAAPGSFDNLTAAMGGHVVAAGQIIGLGQFDSTYVAPPAPK